MTEDGARDAKLLVYNQEWSHTKFQEGPGWESFSLCKVLSLSHISVMNFCYSIGKALLTSPTKPPIVTPPDIHATFQPHRTANPRVFAYVRTSSRNTLSCYHLPTHHSGSSSSTWAHLDSWHTPITFFFFALNHFAIWFPLLDPKFKCWTPTTIIGWNPGAITF